jgi:hypothetical protein
MQKQQLKELIDMGRYRPEAGEVAQAMLRRRAVRELLIGASVGTNGNGKLDASHPDRAGGLFSPAGRIQSPSAVPRQAA